ncbi:glycosyltransferase family 2 protein [Pseudoalteromonas ruthenica]|uniref:glycosyltransferase family 2 protein n=1 Tax=Pseudoalteromonas ruthenica TaxID=151081 RepID=UPI00241E0556|nr:glycosyltransferase family 2 protein [Pseudoalteromonas ruthenica]
MESVSIIMPAYNVEDYIEESIRSVIEQTYSNWELIIIDDRSTDQTISKVEPFLADNRIKLLVNECNLGGAGTRNRGIDMASGRFIAFLDSDDLWSPEKLEQQVDFMLSNGHQFCFTGYSNISETGKYLNEVECPKKVSFSDLLKSNYIGCLTVMYDTATLGKQSMPLYRKRQDYALWLKLLKLTGHAYGLQSSLAQYRIRGGSLSKSKVDAIKFYWQILRDVGKCSVAKSSYNLLCYLSIVCVKKFSPSIYNNYFLK